MRVEETDDGRRASCADGLRSLTPEILPTTTSVGTSARSGSTTGAGCGGAHTRSRAKIVSKLVSGRLVFTPRPDRSYEFVGRVQFGEFLKGIVFPQILDRFTGSIPTVTISGLVRAA